MAGSAASLRRRYTERIRNGSRTADPVIRDEVLADVRQLIHLIGELGDVRCDEDLDFNSETMRYFKLAQLLFRELGCALEAYEMGLAARDKMVRQSVVHDPPLVCARCSRRPFLYPSATLPLA